MSRPITSVFAYLCFVHLVGGKVFTTCELVMELRRQGFVEDQLNQWLCLIDAESSKNTAAIGGPDMDGSFDYGLFQINDRYWCSSDDQPGKGCNIRCEDLLSDDITDASQCSMLIYGKQGFSAWVGWENECKGKILPEINCP